MKAVTISTLVLLMGMLGCSTGGQATAVVKLPSDVSARNQLLSYTQSAAFEADVRALAGTNVTGSFTISVSTTKNTSLAKLGATAVSPDCAVAVATGMSTSLKAYAAKHQLGTVQLIELPSPRSR